MDLHIVQGRGRRVELCNRLWIFAEGVPHTAGLLSANLQVCRQQNSHLVVSL
jgi:hypothetical protein